MTFMAKVYDYARFKILREIKDLENFVRTKYEESKKTEYMWFDHYSVSYTRMRIDELYRQLNEMDNDSPIHKK